MSYFTQKDFVENWEQLTCIINHKIGQPILTPFKNHTDIRKKKFNRLLNEYIREIGRHSDWKKVMLNEFNDLVQEELWDNPKFKVENQFVKEGGHEVLLTDEQKEFLEKKRIEMDEKEIVY